MRQKIMMGCVLILGVMTLSTAHAKRVALLIGNATYQYENRLSNPINDAVLLQNVLKNDLKFDFKAITNLRIQEEEGANTIGISDIYSSLSHGRKTAYQHTFNFNF